MKHLASPGRDGFWANTAPASESLDWLIAITPFGWSASVTLFGREWLVGRTKKQCVVLGEEGEED